MTNKKAIRSSTLSPKKKLVISNRNRCIVAIKYSKEILANKYLFFPLKLECDYSQAKLDNVQQ